MRRTIFIILFVFSVSMNVAVVATVGWHYWNQGEQVVPTVAPETPLNKDAVKQISQVWPRHRRAEMRKTRGKIREKKLELLEFIANNPGDLKAAEKKVDELVSLRATMEKQAITRISKIMESLPPEKRAAFLQFLQTRACRGHRMGRGMRRGMRHGFGPGMGPGMMGHGMGRGRRMEQRFIEGQNGSDR